MLRISRIRAPGKPFTFGALACILLVISFVACSPQVEFRNVEVTRQVPVTREVPVTVEHTSTVEVTREVPVTREIPVTVQVLTTVETPVTRKVEVTSEVPVTRIVAATPRPTATPLPPTPVPTPVPTPAPPASQSKLGNWRLEQDFHARREVAIFRNDAIFHEPLPDPPELVFLCDNRGYRSMYIDWRHPVIGVIDTSITPYASDPFDIYRQVDANVLLSDYARRLHKFVDGIRLQPRDNGRFADLWRVIQREYDLHDLTSAEDLLAYQDMEEPEETGAPDDTNADDEIILSPNRGTALIQLDFVVEIPRFLREDWYRPSVRANIRSNWRVLPNQRTLMGDGPIGSVNQAYQSIAPPSSDEDSLRVITASVAEPDQPVDLFAKWEVTGLDRALEHCRDFGN